ncbi:LOW QUALITY PROTEIN: kup system potassium uptake protein [Brevundimonas abyssalis TAR-001]|uniref:Probable potassium transport system protein Kup n=1 Tax=Brevundimonas abyssalis TAR-001 TaxID=1391729 RepID=A0A8E0NBY1_9CAUL|nr:LOW QUALITY PROTEIN: kup system potassium uptake protein [Brevundimonas abyssalis TAR-001]
MAGTVPGENGASPAASPTPDGASEHSTSHGSGHGRGPLLALTVGAIGVVFGDIGTSPLYAMRESLARTSGAPEMAVLGVLSLIFWALILVVTVKYVIFLMRADNKGEGGTLSLMSLAQRALGRRSTLIFFLGLCGAALFYADGVLTPAVSVLSAVEGLREAPGVGRILTPFVLPITAGILIALFMVQSRGTAGLAKAFGPITAVWFLILAGLGIMHIFDDVSILRGISPHYGILFLIDNGFLGFIILGSVFLAVTGAEALYTDMGHFGKAPIRAGWLVFVLPCLMLNYLGQGALALSHPAAVENLFWMMVPQAAYWPILIMATLATIIASQAVITGAFSITQQAVQLGLLPRMNIRRTSETQAGQIFVPSVNMMMLAGVLLLLAMFPTSSQLAAPYGVAVTGAMFVDSLLAFFIVRYMWKRSLLVSILALTPFLIIDIAFFGSNLMKIPDGAWAPLAIGGAIVMVMWTWTRGTRLLTDKARKDSLPMADLIEMLGARPPYRRPATAIFLTSDPDVAPVALMHNLKHNKVLHEKNIILTVRTQDRPRVSKEKRVEIEIINDDFKRLTINYGFMESPNVPKALGLCRKQGLKFDIMSTSFFLGRRSVAPAPGKNMPHWQDKLYVFLMRNAANPTDFFHIPAGRVVEMGTQVTV